MGVVRAKEQISTYKLPVSLIPSRLLKVDPSTNPNALLNPSLYFKV
jgi:hypothetical protein